MTLQISLVVTLVAAVLCSMIAAFIPHISINYISIAVGMLIALVGPLNKLVAPFHVEIFMYMVAPLIYFEGQTTRIYLVKNSLIQILNLCIVLVLVSMIILGSFVSLLGVPIALAFLIAAVSTPTDATATETVSEGLIVPGEQEIPLKMESLFNDATAIILVGATAFWVEGGNLNYESTMTSFLVSALGGIVVGIVIALLMINFRRWLNRQDLTAYNAQNLLFLITPFFIYFVAEEMHVSGILAVVCAGLMQNSESINSRFIYPRSFHSALVLMNLCREVFNNSVFIILGILFVRIIRTNIFDRSFSWNWLLVGVVIYLANLAVRFMYGKLSRMSNKGSLIFAIGGVRGAVTLALVFLVADRLTGQQFQEVILAETVLIILSMVVPSIILPFLLPHKIAEKKSKQKSRELKNQMVDEGLQVIDHIYLPERVKQRVCFDLRDQRAANSIKEFWQQWARTNQYPRFTGEERELAQRALLRAFRAERDFLDMVSQRENMEDYVFQLYNDILLAESILVDPENWAN